MQPDADRPRLYPTSVRNFVFFLAVLAMNYTLSRPSPVDFLFMLSLALSIMVLQKVRLTFFIFFTLLLLWTLSFLYASAPFFSDPDVRQEAFKKTFVVVLGITACYVSLDWGPRQLHAFMRVYVVSCVIAAILGIVGFALGIEALMWDGRSKGFIDDPNMYASFLVPGVVMAIYLVQQRLWLRVVLFPIIGILCLGVLLSFSRAATVSLILCCSGYMVFIYRKHLLRLFAYAAAMAVFGGIILGTTIVVSPTFTKKFEQRATLEESYDAGREGRYGRYARSIPIILSNPIGIGINQQDLIFVEPIHNIWLSSFMNYGWVAGFSWVALIFLSVLFGLANYRMTAHPAAVAVLVAFMAPLMCASLHEGEHWRHLWLLLGILWGFNPARFHKATEMKRNARRSGVVEAMKLAIASNERPAQNGRSIVSSHRI
ncbi:O-antigen ligase family protein [Afifella aestuarii]|uniref:O-antigen ligase family protein n=1 Tax=Afifella aestuarii TaxID=1909496 RepID=UPI0013E391EF|nr:O-antigen ligase family protein [Afifella aestuarii]